MFAALRRVPAPLLAAQLLVGGIYVLWAGLSALEIHWSNDDGTLWMLFQGGQFAAKVLTLIGLVWLAARLSGSARRAARIAAFGAGLYVVAGFASVTYVVYTASAYGEPSITVLKANSLVTALATMIVAFGLGIAARRVIWTLLAMAAAVLANPPWFLWDMLSLGKPRSTAMNLLVFSGPQIAAATSILALAVYAVHEARSGDDARAARGFCRTELGLYGIAAAAVTIAITTVFPDSRPAQLAGGGAMLVEATCLFALATGALEAVRTPLTAIAAATALCVAYRMLLNALAVARHELFPHGHLYAMAFGSEAPRPPYIAVPLFTALAAAAVLAAIGLAARRRELEALRLRAVAIAGVVVGVGIGAMTLQHAIDGSDPTPLGSLLQVLGSIALAASYVLAARAVQAGAHALAGTSSLPIARVIPRDPAAL